MPYIKERSNREVIQSVIEYNVPHLFSVVQTMEDVPFLYLMVFPGKARPEALEAPGVPASLEILRSLQSIMSSPIEMPGLGMMLFNGALRGLEKHPPLAEATAEEALKMAADTNDIFFILTPPGTGKEDIIQKLRGEYTNNFQHYLKRLELQHQPAFDLPNKVEKIKRTLASFLFGRKAVRHALLEVQLLLFGHLNTDLSRKLNTLILDLATPLQKDPSPAFLRLVKGVYALPYNAIIYSDNGEQAVQETLVRLQKHQLGDYANALSNLLKDHDGTDQWFEDMAALRKDMLLHLHSPQADYVSEQQKQKILNLLDDILNYLITKNQSMVKDPVLQDLIQTLTQCPNKAVAYMKDAPFWWHNSTIMVDFDAKPPLDMLNKELARAKRIVMLSSYPNDVARVFLNAARAQEGSEKRAVCLSATKVMHPFLAQFINIHFYEGLGLAPLESTNKNDEFAFVWICEGAATINWMSHIMETVSKGESVAIFTEQPEVLAKHLSAQGMDKELGQLVISSRAWQGNGVYDAVYYLPSHNEDGSLNPDELCNAMHRAGKTFVTVGNPEKLRQGTPLYALLHVCIGDEKHGKFYR